MLQHSSEFRVTRDADKFWTNIRNIKLLSAFMCLIQCLLSYTALQRHSRQKNLQYCYSIHHFLASSNLYQCQYIVSKVLKKTTLWRPHLWSSRFLDDSYKQAIISWTLIPHKQNVINWSFIPGKPFHTLAYHIYCTVRHITEQPTVQQQESFSYSN